MKDKARSLDVIKGSLEAIGYNNKKIIDKYPVTNKNGKIIYFDLVALVMIEFRIHPLLVLV